MLGPQPDRARRGGRVGTCHDPIESTTGDRPERTERARGRWVDGEWLVDVTERWSVVSDVEIGCQIDTGVIGQRCERWQPWMSGEAGTAEPRADDLASYPLQDHE